MDSIYIALFVGGIGGLIIGLVRDNNKKKKIELETIQRNESKEKRQGNEIKNNLEILEGVNNHIEKFSLIKLHKVGEYKGALINSEDKIIAKGGETQFFTFMKVTSFLNSFEDRLKKDKSEILETFDTDSIRERIIEEASREGIDKVVEYFQDVDSRTSGGQPSSFQGQLDYLSKSGEVLCLSMKNQTNTLRFYEGMAISMIAFYLNDSRVRYFEIYEAFEKLGVFDSTWNKQVLMKLDNIESRLSQLNGQLTQLNSNFQTLVESSEKIISELKEINDQMITTNLLQAITAYQAYRINKL